MKKGTIKTRVLAGILAFSLFAGGCGGTSSQVSATPSYSGPSQAAGSAAPQEVERTPIRYAAWTSGPFNKETFAEKAIEEAFPDIDIELMAFERATWNEQINTRVASGDIPDIIFRDSRTLVDQYRQQGIIRDIPIEAIKEYAPNIYKEVGEYGYDTWISSYFDGKIYGFPSTTINNTIPFTNGFREDWLTNVGIDKVPETLAEVEEAFKRLTENDPDRNGKNDTYAITANGMTGMLTSFSFVFGAFGVFPNMWMDDGSGGVEFGMVSSKMIPALETLNRWYKAGYIDPEFVTNDAAKVKQAWANGKVGFIETTWNRLVYNGEMVQALNAVNPDAKVVLAPASKGPDGEYGYYNWGRLGGSMTLAKHLEKDESKFIKCLKLLDGLAYDQDLYYLTHYGVENEQWKRDEATNSILKINGYDEADKMATLGNALLIGLPLPSVQRTFLPKNLDEVSKYALPGTVKENEDYYIWVGALISNEATTAAQSATDMQLKAMIEFIIGTRPISEFNTFVEQWNKAGGTALTEAANEAFTAGLEVKNEIEEKMK